VSRIPSPQPEGDDRYDETLRLNPSTRSGGGPPRPACQQGTIADRPQPEHVAGDAILLQPIRGEIAPGMVVSYEHDGKLITHRVVQVSGDSLRTKGDQAHSEDPWTVSVADVVGTPLVRFPYLGFVLQWMREPFGWILLVALPAAMIVLDELRIISGILKRGRKPKAVPTHSRKTLHLRPRMGLRIHHEEGMIAHYPYALPPQHSGKDGTS
jgi:signal peptidase I